MYISLIQKRADCSGSGSKSGLGFMLIMLKLKLEGFLYQATFSKHPTRVEYTAKSPPEAGLC